MNLGAYTACLHSYSLGEALDILRGYGLRGAEVNVGGFIPAPHCPVDSLLASATARDEYLGIFAEKDMVLAGLNTSGNPLSPHPRVGPKHAEDLRKAIDLAGALGVEEIVCMSGAPGSDPGALYPSWVVNPWDGVYMDILDYQMSVAVPFWKEMDLRAQDAGVKLALELHPHNLIFTPVGFLRFAEEINAVNVGVNMDPSHLMWQGMDSIASTKLLGKHIFHVHAKDTKIFPGVATQGVLTTEFSRPDPAGPRCPSGIDFWCSNWPTDPAWRFVCVGLGHEVPWWNEFLQAIREINPHMNVNIEHEDSEYSTLDGLEIAAGNLLAAAQ